MPGKERTFVTPDGGVGYIYKPLLSLLWGCLLEVPFALVVCLHQLAAGELGPATDLRGNALDTGHLLAHGLGEEESSL